MSDRETNDPAKKIRDASANTGDSELNWMEEALIIRLRERGQNAQ